MALLFNALFPVSHCLEDWTISYILKEIHSQRDVKEGSLWGNVSRCLVILNPALIADFQKWTCAVLYPSRETLVTHWQLGKLRAVALPLCLLSYSTNIFHINQLLVIPSLQFVLNIIFVLITSFVSDQACTPVVKPIIINPPVTIKNIGTELRVF